MGSYSKEQAISIVVGCAEKYRDNLMNRSLLIAHSDKHKNLECIELTFDASNFMHLTGLKLNGITADDFYDKCLSHRLSIDDFEFSNDGTTSLKLDVLPSVMTKKLSANMIGDYNSSNPKLYTEKLVGGEKACMGFVQSGARKRYVPNTLLKFDIRDISSNTRRIVAVFRKPRQQSNYEEITYRAKNFDWNAATLPGDYAYLNDILNVNQ